MRELKMKGKPDLRVINPDWDEGYERTFKKEKTIMQGLELINFKEMIVAEVFSPGGLQPILDAIAEKVESYVPDLTTEEGRKDIASFSAKIASSKIFIDDRGKEFGEAKRADLKKLDAERKRARDFLIALKIKARKPLTDWEATEQGRVDDILLRINQMKDLVNTIGFNTVQIKEYIDILRKLFKENVFAEFIDEAKIVFENVLNTLENNLSSTIIYEKEQVELAELRKEKEKREVKEKADRAKREVQDANRKLKKEAAEKATKKAEKVANEKIQKAKDAEQKAIDEKKDAQQRVKDAEQKAKDAEQKVKDKIAADFKLENDKRKEREANEKYRAKIKGEFVDYLYTNSRLTKQESGVIFESIVNDEFPHTKIIF